MIRKFVAFTLAASLLAAGAFAAGQGPNPAQVKLKEAASLRRTSFKKPKEEKRRILLETAKAYEEIITEFSSFPGQCAEASFRAGEIYRTLGMAERAESSFLRTLKFDSKGEFAARSLNEAGHIHRRKKEYEKAIGFYSRTIRECPEARSACADAVTWTGKVYLKMKEIEKGRQTLIGFAERFPDFPVEAIRNMDLAARSFIDEGRYDEAGSVIESCKDRFDSFIREKKYKKKMAGMIERALRNMKAAERLEGLLSEEGKRTGKSGGKGGEGSSAKAAASSSSMKSRDS